MTSMVVVIVIEMDPFKFIDENLPDLSGFPNFFICQIFFSGYGHCHISGSLNFIKKYLQDFFGQAILIYVNW